MGLLSIIQQFADDDEAPVLNPVTD